MNLSRYVQRRRKMIDDALERYAREGYPHGGRAGMLAYATRGGKRLRGILVMLACEAAGGRPRDARRAACAVEVCQAASLVKDDLIDRSPDRRGRPAFWMRYGPDLTLLAPDTMVPQAILYISQYGIEALHAVLTAWSRMAEGQLLDSWPRNGSEPDATSYEDILRLKTASLWEAACELGVRAARQPALVAPAVSYGHSTGMAFQLYDDAVDLHQAMGGRWDSIARRDGFPVSLAALRSRAGSGDLVRQEDCRLALKMGAEYLRQAQETARTFPDSPSRELLAQFPAHCCNALLAEAGVA
jgi:geranylgeranyl diphosphate synthase, type I